MYLEDIANGMNRSTWNFLFFPKCYLLLATEASTVINIYNINRTLHALWLVKNPCLIRVNHKNYNFSIVIGLKNSFPLIHLPSCYRTVCCWTVCYRYWTVCYRTVQQANRIQSCSLNQLITFKVVVTWTCACFCVFWRLISARRGVALKCLGPLWDTTHTLIGQQSC